MKEKTDFIFNMQKKSSTWANDFFSTDFYQNFLQNRLFFCCFCSFSIKVIFSKNFLQCSKIIDIVCVDIALEISFYLMMILMISVGLIRSDSGHFENWTKIFRCPMSLGASEWASEQTSELRGACERSEQCGASERVNGWVSGPLLTSRF